ncbi:MAG: hypothetical protein WCS17_08090 [Prevotella sp.]
MIDQIFDDEKMLSALYKGADIARINGLAIETAMQSHPVTSYVRDLPFESYELYPAKSGTYQSIIGLKKPKVRNSEKIDSGIPNMFWTLPARDTKKLENGNCGVVSSIFCRDIPMNSCSLNKDHFSKAIGNHCWSMRCPVCMNSTVMKAGVKAEQKILAPGDLYERKTGTKLKIGHWQISPPQKWLQHIMQNSSDFMRFYDDLIEILKQNGIRGGAIVFHPWRLSDIYQTINHVQTGNFKEGLPEFLLAENHIDLKWEYRNLEHYWRFGPHFHFIGYGHFTDTEEFRSSMAKLDKIGNWGEDGQEETWVVKKIHPSEEIDSVRHTISYLLTHAGLGSYYYENNWDLDGEDLIIPSKVEGNSVKAKEEPMSIHKSLDPNEQNYLEDYSNFDFVKWTEDRMYAQIPSIRYFGIVNDTRILGIFKEKKQNICPCCGSVINMYRGVCDCSPEPSLFMRESKIRVSKTDYDFMSEYVTQHTEIAKNGLSLLDFAINVPQCSTPETMGVQDYDPNITPIQRSIKNDRCLIYVDSITGQGLDPKIVSRKDYQNFIKKNSFVSKQNITMTTFVKKPINTVKKRRIPEKPIKIEVCP